MTAHPALLNEADDKAKADKQHQTAIFFSANEQAAGEV